MPTTVHETGCEHCAKLRQFGQCCETWCSCRLAFLERERYAAREIIREDRARREFREFRLRRGRWVNGS